MFISFKIIEEIVIKLNFVVFDSLLHPKCGYGYPHSTLYSFERKVFSESRDVLSLVKQVGSRCKKW